VKWTSDKRLKEAEAEAALEQMVQQQWLRKDRRNLQLGMRRPNKLTLAVFSPFAPSTNSADVKPWQFGRVA